MSEALSALDINEQNNMTWDLLEKTGFNNGGWDYDEPNMTYNEDIDQDTGSDVNYNALGTAGTWTNTNKS